MAQFRIETDTMGAVKVPKERLFGAQTQRSIEHFCISTELMPREMIPAYALAKKACALANAKQKLLTKERATLIARVCDEILAGKWDAEFPLHVWMTGSGTQFNMNVNEVISNRCCQLSKQPLGSKKPIHPNDHVNMSQSSNDTFPAVMHIAAALAVKEKLIPALQLMHQDLLKKARLWKGIVKLGRTHLQDATPLTLGQEFSGYAALLESNLQNLEHALEAVYALTLGGTAVGTGINTLKGFDKLVAQEVARLTKLPFKTAKNKFAYQGSHDALVHLSSTLKTTAVSLYKIASDIQFLSCGPRAGIYELILPSNEPGSSIMPGKVNPTQCEALCMLTIQVMANDVAISFGGAGGSLEMNVYKPLIIHNLLQSIRLLEGGCHNFCTYCLKGMQPNLRKIKKDLRRSLMLVTALCPLIGYDKAAQLAKHAMEHDLELKEAALDLKLVTSEEFDKLVNPLHMCFPD